MFVAGLSAVFWFSPKLLLIIALVCGGKIRVSSTVIVFVWEKEIVKINRLFVYSLAFIGFWCLYSDKNIILYGHA